MHSHCWEAIPSIHLQNFFIFPERNRAPMKLPAELRVCSVPASLLWLWSSLRTKRAHALTHPGSFPEICQVAQAYWSVIGDGRPEGISPPTLPHESKPWAGGQGTQSRRRSIHWGPVTSACSGQWRRNPAWHVGPGHRQHLPVHFCLRTTSAWWGERCRCLWGLS